MLTGIVQVSFDGRLFCADRKDFGNTPDTSKALRLLVSAHKVKRLGIGGRSDPFEYQVPGQQPGALSYISPEGFACVNAAFNQGPPPLSSLLQHTPFRVNSYVAAAPAPPNLASTDLRRKRPCAALLEACQASKLRSCSDGPTVCALHRLNCDSHGACLLHVCVPAVLALHLHSHLPAS